MGGGPKHRHELIVNQSVLYGPSRVGPERPSVGGTTVCRFSPPRRADARREAPLRAPWRMSCAVRCLGRGPGRARAWHTRAMIWTCGRRAPLLPRGRARLGPAERTANGPPMAAGPPVSAGAGPIAVDDTVLACCNCAYDVARFHASQDVRLEHLLHALTRVGAAVDVLAELGIRVDTLRRETAVAIAAEMPAGPVEGDGDAARLRRLRGRAAARRRPGRQAARAGRPARPAQDHAGRRSRIARGRPPDAGRRRSAAARALARCAAARGPQFRRAGRRLRRQPD